MELKKKLTAHNPFEQAPYTHSYLNPLLIPTNEKTFYLVFTDMEVKQLLNVNVTTISGYFVCNSHHLLCNNRKYL